MYVCIESLSVKELQSCDLSNLKTFQLSMTQSQAAFVLLNSSQRTDFFQTSDFGSKLLCSPLTYRDPQYLIDTIFKIFFLLKRPHSHRAYLEAVGRVLIKTVWSSMDTNVIPSRYWKLENFLEKKHFKQFWN